MTVCVCVCVYVCEQERMCARVHCVYVMHVLHVCAHMCSKSYMVTSKIVSQVHAVCEVY